MNPETLRSSVLLLRKQLGSVDFQEIERLKQTELTDEEFQARASAAEAFYKHYFEKVLKLKIQEQLEKIGFEATNNDQVVFGRGSLNGLILVKGWFEDQMGISKGERQGEEKPEPGETL
jgi:hypothetical protein